MTFSRGFIALFEIRGEGIAEPETVATYLVGVCRSDAFAGSADFGSAFGFLICSIKKPVCRHYQMGFLGYF